MSLFIRIAVVVSSLALIQAATLDLDDVVPFPESKPTTNENTVALEFKPKLAMGGHCRPYPAVDEDGNVSEGGGNILYIRCEGSPHGSQVYGRVAKYKEFWAIMYAWYFPRAGFNSHSWENVIVWLDSLTANATISAVSTTSILGRYDVMSPVDPSVLDGNSLKVYYRKLFGSRSIWPTKHSGIFQDLVMWDDMSEEARTALENADFDSATVPMTDANFLANVEKAYPS
ncbi:hypothetical protein PHYBOEH_009259 [Phytophthora boehmeriae]|uniref:Uncharacterized protein n=1 Tax=Phytophthora boehmeriae TaxID=109152 RepID=A0A8T1VU56_9STRA|nr:hypothetical protein PHYBOEH_009259 [Phytophthora boehmeriae]